MNNLKHKKMNFARRTNRVRSTVNGTSDRPRLSVHISLLHVSAQIIDDSKGKTLAAVTTVGGKATGNLSEKAGWVGTEIAKKANKAKVTRVVLDRRGRKYHGRIKSLADAARAGGLEF